MPATLCLMCGQRRIECGGDTSCPCSPAAPPDERSLRPVSVSGLVYRCADGRERMVQPCGRLVTCEGGG